MTDFETFWARQVRKVGKLGVMKTYWPRACKIDTPENIIAGWEAQRPKFQAMKDSGDIQYVPHPSTWLNHGRWMDEVEQAPTGERPYDTWSDDEKTKAADFVIRNGRDMAIRTKYLLGSDVERLTNEGYLGPGKVAL